MRRRHGPRHSNVRRQPAVIARDKSRTLRTMKAITFLVETTLLHATDRAARRRGISRSALVREGLHAYLRHQAVDDREHRDRAGYVGHPDHEFAAWDQVA